MSYKETRDEGDLGDLGDLVILLLTGTLAGLRDRLYADGFPTAADLVADLVDITDDYVGRLQGSRPNDPRQTFPGQP